MYARAGEKCSRFGGAKKKKKEEKVGEKIYDIVGVEIRNTIKKYYRRLKIGVRGARGRGGLVGGGERAEL